MPPTGPGTSAASTDDSQTQAVDASSPSATGSTAATSDSTQAAGSKAPGDPHHFLADILNAIQSYASQSNGLATTTSLSA